MSFAPGTPQPHSPQAGPMQPVAPQPRGAWYAGPGGLGGPGGPGVPGRPGGPTALAGCVPAAPGRRSAAALVEGLVVASPAVVANVAVQVGLAKELPGLVVVGVVLSLAWLAGFVVVGLRFAQTGVSPGKKAMGLRLVDVRTGGAPGLAAWGRFALAGVGSAVLVGWVLAVTQILTNKGGERRAWYDALTHLVLLDVEAGRDPFLAFSGGPASSSFPHRSGAAADHDGDPRSGGRTWAGPAISTLAPGQHGTQVGQGPGGATPPPTGRSLAPVPPPPPVVAPPPPASAPIPVGVVHLPPVPPPPPPAAEAAPAAPAVPAAPAAPAVPAISAAPASPVAPTAAVTAPRAIFTFASGQVHEATGAGVIGRAPRPSRTGAMPVIEPGVLTVTDVTRTVSKAHLAFEVEASGVWLTDLGSTNGSTVTGVRGTPMALVAGAAVLAAYGSTVTVGELSFALALAPAAPEEDDGVEFTIQRDRR